MAIVRVHSSDVQVFVNDQRIPAINSLGVNSTKENHDIPRLGVSHITDKILGPNQNSTIALEAILTTGATGIDPFYSFQQMQSGFLSTGKFEFKVKDLAGVTTISGASLTSYTVDGSVGEAVSETTQYIGDGAIFTPAGALVTDNQSTDQFGGFFVPQKIQITTSTNGEEGIDSDSLYIQSFSLSVDVGKNPVTRLGTRTPQFRYPEMPANGSLDFKVIKNKVTGINISSLVCSSGVIKIDLKDNENNSVIDFTTSGCSLESIDETTRLDDNTEIAFSYNFPIIK